MREQQSVNLDMKRGLNEADISMKYELVCKSLHRKV